MAKRNVATTLDQNAERDEEGTTRELRNATVS